MAIYAYNVCMHIRVRMAPSPTGQLHIGTARTALFNWIFAKKNNGVLILRLEDTDVDRSTSAYEKDIIEQLQWLGLQWDEGPFRQSERAPLYTKCLTALLEKGYAYYCDCPKETLEAEREAMREQGIAPRYRGTCREKKISAGKGTVIRFAMPEKNISFIDLVRGKIEFNTALIGDFVIAKNLQTPLYNFAVVVDDADMDITHIIRGEDHIPNTPKQIAIQEALGFKHPHYAHIPLILDADRSKMSKRNSATALADYRAAGYLPEAIINFLTLLGWHPQNNREIMSIEDSILMFDLGRVQKAGAVFSLEKLNWINAQYIKKTHDAELLQYLSWELSEHNIKIIELLKPRTQTMNDFKTLGAFFFTMPDYEPRLLQWKEMKPQEIISSLERTALLIREGRAHDIPASAEQHGRGETFWPLRAALSGQQESPGPLEILAIIGKEEALARIAIALKKLNGAGEEFTGNEIKSLFN